MSAIALPGWVATYGLARVAAVASAARELETFARMNDFVAQSTRGVSRRKTSRRRSSQRPEICEELSRVLSERVVAVRAARENLTEQARVTMVANQHRSIRDRIERFFGLVD